MSATTLLGLIALLLCAVASAVLSALQNYSLHRLLEQLRDRQLAAGKTGTPEHEEELRERYARFSDDDDVSILTAMLVRGLAMIVAVLALFPQDGLALLDWQALGRLALAFAVIVFGGCVLPELCASSFAESIVLRAMPAMRLLDRLLRPLTRLAELVAIATRRLLGVPEISEEDQVEDEILDGLTSGERAHLVKREQTEMIKSIFELDETDVRDIMTPRTDVMMIQVETPLMEAVAHVIDSAHSRIPVYGETRDEIVGILYAKDLLKTWVASATAAGGAALLSLRSQLRKPFFVPENLGIGALLADMRRSGTHLAVILDEYGGCAGIVTIEDIVEEIVGDIQDEHDREDEEEEADVVLAAHGVVDCSGQAHIDELQKVLGIELEEINGSPDTVAGYLFAQLGRIPEVDSSHVLGNLRFLVLAGDERRINRLRVEVLSPAEAQAPSG